jgi:hypothetical protein
VPRTEPPPRCRTKVARSADDPVEAIRRLLSEMPMAATRLMTRDGARSKQSCSGRGEVPGSCLLIADAPSTLCDQSSWNTFSRALDRSAPCPNAALSSRPLLRA